MVNNSDIEGIVIVITLIFLIAPTFIIIYILVYNRRKKHHIEEKEKMKIDFDNELVKTQLEVQEQTMQTIGADLHDNIGQLLSLTSLTLNSIELDDDLAKAQQKIDSVIDLTKRSIKEMRLLGKLLQGDQLIVLGLSEAIRHQINWMEKAGQYAIAYEQVGAMPLINNPDKDLILFRILQEILNNIIKHSFATKINISLTCIEPRMQLQIEDNGVGFDADNLPPEKMGMGLMNIRKRVQIVGGEVSIQSQPGKGTSIIIFIPYP